MTVRHGSLRDRLLSEVELGTAVGEPVELRHGFDCGEALAEAVEALADDFRTAVA